MSNPIPEFRTKYYPIIIDFVADPPFEIVRYLEKEKQVKVTQLKIETVKEIHQIELRFINQIAEIQQKYLEDVSKLMV